MTLPKTYLSMMITAHNDNLRVALKAGECIEGLIVERDMQTGTWLLALSGLALPHTLLML